MNLIHWFNRKRESVQISAGCIKRLCFFSRITGGGHQPLSLGRKPVITARKQSLGQGNVFTSICYSVHQGSGVVGSASKGAGSASRGRVCIQEVCIQGAGWADPPNGYYGIRPTSGRYASYWNAFLFEKILPKTVWKWKKLDKEGARIPSATRIHQGCWHLDIFSSRKLTEAAAVGARNLTVRHILMRSNPTHSFCLEL